MKQGALILLCAWVLWAHPSATAAGVWVLWHESTRTPWVLPDEKIPAASSAWTVSQTYPSHDQCDRALVLRRTGWSLLPKEETGDDGSLLTRRVGADRVSVTVV